MQKAKGSHNRMSVTSTVHMKFRIGIHCIWWDVGGVFAGDRFLLSKTRFTSAEQIPQYLLESVIKCYSQRVQACRWCFLTHLSSTLKQLQSLSVTSTSICKKCLRDNGTVTVMPASDLCETSAYGKFVAIPPTPIKESNIPAFYYCPKFKELYRHKRCLLLTRKEDAWFPHSIEEMVIWTIEYKQGKLATKWSKILYHWQWYIVNRIC